MGGDWYDVIELPRGHLGIVIGDVVGHGISAAALMGQLRTALRSYALEGHGPAQTLERLARFVQTMDEQAMATATYAVFDPETGEIALATAGHLPPIFVGADGARMIELTTGTPLGGFAYERYTEHKLSLASEEMLVLYTDGLVERRGTPLQSMIEELVDHVERSAQSGRGMSVTRSTRSSPSMGSPTTVRSSRSSGRPCRESSTSSFPPCQTCCHRSGE